MDAPLRARASGLPDLDFFELRALSATSGAIRSQRGRILQGQPEDLRPAVVKVEGNKSVPEAELFINVKSLSSLSRDCSASSPKGNN